MTERLHGEIRRLGVQRKLTDAIRDLGVDGAIEEIRRWPAGDVELIASQLRADRRALEAVRQREEMLKRVSDYLAEHPDASANSVWRAIGGRRGDVLQAVRDAQVPVPAGTVPATSGGAQLGIVHDRARFLEALKRTVGCHDCGTSEGRLDFDHRPGEVKLFNIANGARRSWDDLLAEIAKCDVRCVSCHTRRHHSKEVHS